MRAVGPVAFGAVLAFVFAASQAQAQQQIPQPLPAGGNQGQQQTQQHQQIAITHWPTTAGQYHVYMTWMIKEMGKLVGAAHSPVTQGDINKVTLRLKDCEASVAADGIVTHNEFRMCERVFNQVTREIKLQYLASGAR